MLSNQKQQNQNPQTSTEESSSLDKAKEFAKEKPEGTSSTYDGLQENTTVEASSPVESILGVPSISSYYTIISSTNQGSILQALTINGGVIKPESSEESQEAITQSQKNRSRIISVVNELLTNGNATIKLKNTNEEANQTQPVSILQELVITDDSIASKKTADEEELESEQYAAIKKLVEKAVEENGSVFLIKILSNSSLLQLEQKSEKRKLQETPPQEMQDEEYVSKSYRDEEQKWLEENIKAREERKRKLEEAQIREEKEAQKRQAEELEDEQYEAIKILIEKAVEENGSDFLIKILSNPSLFLPEKKLEETKPQKMEDEEDEEKLSDYVSKIYRDEEQKWLEENIKAREERKRKLDEEQTPEQKKAKKQQKEEQDEEHEQAMKQINDGEGDDETFQSFLMTL